MYGWVEVKGWTNPFAVTRGDEGDVAFHQNSLFTCFYLMLLFGYTAVSLVDADVSSVNSCQHLTHSLTHSQCHRLWPSVTLLVAGQAL